MPKVINPTGVSVDSLQAKLTLLENQFSKLNSDHKNVVDSLRSLNKTLQIAEIKTNIFTDQLAFQLSWITIVLLVGGWVTWKKIFEPHKEEMQNFISTSIPNLLKLQDEKVDIKIEKLIKTVNKEREKGKERDKNLTATSNNLLAITLGYMTFISREQNDHAFIFFHCIHFSNVLLGEREPDIKSAKNRLNEGFKALTNENFDYTRIKNGAHGIAETITQMQKLGIEDVAVILSKIHVKWMEIYQSNKQ